MIVRLPPDVIAAIAAGEVIERPASAVKELVENSLDAGARRIVVEVEGGGLEMIAVTDDGCGIPSSEIAAAFERHTTSKITSLKDLESISTFGFRGEALASIAACARRVVVTSLARHERTGTRLVIEEGRVAVLEPTGCPQGTRIEVYGVLQHIPARLKFLKDMRRERVLCQRVVTELALGNPQVAYCFMAEGETVFSTQGDGLMGTYQAIFGPEQEMLPVEGETISGLVSVSADWPSRNRQFLFVNGRPVGCHGLRSSVEAAYRSLEGAEQSRYPRFVLNVKVDPHLVDVNVHPAKAEVRFVNEDGVRNAVFSSVRRTLQRSQLGAADAMVAMEKPISLFVEQIPLHKQEGSQGAGPQEVGGTDLKYLGCAYGKYLIMEAADAIYIVDYHAAHERVTYEHLLSKPMGLPQPLLEPISLSLEPGSNPEELAGLLEQLGFEAETFGKLSVIVRAVPTLGDVAGVDWKAILNHALAGGQVRRLEHLAATISACHSSFRSGDAPTPHEATELMKLLIDCTDPYRCPHGRPTFITLSREVLETRFERHG
ncbi:MAG: DNA mismatch repair endonuclease MutL [Bacillota bacterium]